jgi:hypothetical protein
MRRTIYGLTLTENFKERITQEMMRLQVSRKLVSKFREKNYLEIELEDLWSPTVLAVCKVNDCKCKIEGKHVYAPVKKSNIIKMEASAVYHWFRHVKSALEKAKRDYVEVMGEYV